jgi:hypothetical protein
MEKSLGVYTVAFTSVHGARDYPSFSPFSIASATLSHSPRLAFFRPFRSLSPPTPFSRLAFPTHPYRSPSIALSVPTLLLVLSRFLSPRLSSFVSTPDHRRSVFIEPLRAQR